MKATLHGCLISLYFSENELSSNYYSYTLPDGYSIKTVIVVSATNILFPFASIPFSSGTSYTFPVVNGKSPNVFSLYIKDTTKSAILNLLIEEFGQKPDEDYFNETFEPILVTGKDGEEYKMIPSDQFK